MVAELGLRLLLLNPWVQVDNQSSNKAFRYEPDLHTFNKKTIQYKNYRLENNHRWPVNQNTMTLMSVYCNVT